MYETLTNAEHETSDLEAREEPPVHHEPCYHPGHMTLLPASECFPARALPSSTSQCPAMLHDGACVH